MNNSKPKLKGTKKLFIQLGTCSRTLCHILNREFGHPMETEELASDPLAGGIMQRGHQCGMLWGAALAVGAESYRSCGACSPAIGKAITATQSVMESFSNRTKCINCRDITQTDMRSKWDMMKYFFSGRFISCFTLADKWAPEAVRSAVEGLSQPIDSTHSPVSCATEVARKMGATDEEMVMVAGFAGGMGLSGNACGALGAAIWMNSLVWCREQNDSNTIPDQAVGKKRKVKTPFYNPYAKSTIMAFYRATDSKILCHKISGKRFNSIESHTAYIKEGGCKNLINALTNSKVSSFKFSKSA
mgnify:CR=1 FL=1|jgi:hypothetical protein